MNSTAFSFLANSNPEVDENQKKELTIGSLSFYIGPSGLTRLSNPAKSGPSTSKIKTITMSRSSVGSSSEVNSPASFAATENTQKKIKELNEEPDIEGTVDKSCDSQRDFTTGSSGISRAYISYASLSLKQEKRTITRIMEKSTRKSTNQGTTVRRRRKKFTSPPGSGESSCQPSITEQKYPPIQEEKF
jgi:hypothetical protein